MVTSSVPYKQAQTDKLSMEVPVYARLDTLKTLGSATLVAAGLMIAGCGGETTSDDDNNNDNNLQGNSILPESVSCDERFCTLTAGDYATDMVWEADRQFLLEGNVFIDGAALTIKPGVEVFASGRTALIVRPGAKIMAEGTKDAPIVFTSAKAEGERDRGDWGGLIINGSAPVNCAASTGGTCEGEGSSGAYGGSDPMDDSGVLRYVRVEFAGSRITDEDEYNGIAFQGVGAGTTVEYVHVHKPSDDGIEFFGGSVSAKHILVTGAGDDSIDWTFGWNGRLQFGLVQQYDDEADRGIEADNNSKANDAEPRSNPIISNVTFVGADGPDTQIGVMLRAGTAAQLHNLIVHNFETCLDVDDDATFDMSRLAVANSVFSCATGTTFDEEATDPFAVSELVMNQAGNSTDPAEMMDPVNQAQPDFRPLGASASGGQAPSDPFFTSVTFKGGVDPTNDWTAGWASFPAN